MTKLAALYALTSASESENNSSCLLGGVKIRLTDAGEDLEAVLSTQ